MNQKQDRSDFMGGIEGHEMTLVCLEHDSDNKEKNEDIGQENIKIM